MTVEQSRVDLSAISRVLRDVAAGHHPAERKAESTSRDVEPVRVGLTVLPLRRGDSVKRPPSPISIKAKALRDLRREMAGAFSSGMIGDPAFDMLLDLLIADEEGFRMTVSDLLRKEVPPTTVLRWLTRLEDEGLAERAPDPYDRRRFYISLTEDCRLKVRNLVEQSPLQVVAPS